METNVSKLETYFSSIQKNNKLKDAVIIEGLNMLSKLLTNIINNPTETKFRTIKRSNATLKAKLFVIPIMENILQTIGFSLVDDNFIMLEPNIVDIINALPLIRATIEEVNDQSLPAEERAKKIELRQRQKELDMKFKKDKEEAEKLKKLSQLDRKEKAQEEKANDSIGNTMQFGAKTKCFKDIGIDLNKQRRG